ncbi:MAG TPA: nucleoside 2-deoxyribosyltransferase [Bryobacteraceae bacterium]|nr:nucleoside 2-deoxyribosyltransferase [Bryobacteraceae bacterium]
MKPTLYFAAPLFSQAELAFNANLTRQLEPYFDVYLPQRDGGLFVNLIKEGLTIDAASARIFAMDVTAIKRCDVLLLVLDGRAVDEGAAFELGYGYALGKVCVGLQTDPRRLLPIGNNPMINGPLINVFNSVDNLLAWAASFALVVDAQR